MGSLATSGVTLVVTKVGTGSYAEELGLRPGDRFLSFNREPLTSAQALHHGLNQFSGENVELELLRQDRRILINAPAKPLDLELMELPAPRSAVRTGLWILLALCVLAGLGLAVMVLRDTL